MVNIEEGKKIEKEAEEITEQLSTIIFKDTYTRSVIKEIAFQTLIQKANRDSEIVYISRHQLRGLLDGKIQGIDRTILVDTEQKSTEIRIERSD